MSHIVNSQITSGFMPSRSAPELRRVGRLQIFTLYKTTNCSTGRPCHHLTAGRGGRQQPDGAHQRCYHPPIASNTPVRLTVINPQTEQKQQERTAHCAEKRGSRARMMRVYSLIRTVPAASEAMRASMAAKYLIYAPDRATLTPIGMPLGECRPEAFEWLDERVQGSVSQT